MWLVSIPFTVSDVGIGSALQIFKLISGECRDGEWVWFCEFIIFLIHINVLQDSLFYWEGGLLEIVFLSYHFKSKKSMGQTPWILSSLDPFHQKRLSNQDKLNQRSRRVNVDHRIDFELKILNLTLFLHFADGLGKLLTNNFWVCA